MANNLKITVYKGTKLLTTVTIPTKVLKHSAALVPEPAVLAVKDEGIDLLEIIKLSGKAELSGVLMELEQNAKGEKVIFELTN